MQTDRAPDPALSSWEDLDEALGLSESLFHSLQNGLSVHMGCILPSPQCPSEPPQGVLGPTFSITGDLLVFLGAGWAQG